MADVLGDNGVGHHFYLIALISSILLLILMNGRRKQFVIPTLLMGLVVVNPWFKDLWLNKLHLTYYYRVLWVVPVIPVCAAMVSTISEKINKPNVKGLIALACAGIFALTGSFVYHYPTCEFQIPAENASKLPQDTVDIADYLLSIEDEPRIVADSKISTYIREYSGKIKTLFGRDLLGYTILPNQTELDVNQQINDPDGDLSIVTNAMKEGHYQYLVIDNTNQERVRRFSDSSLKLIHSIRQWDIYTYNE